MKPTRGRPAQQHNCNVCGETMQLAQIIAHQRECRIKHLVYPGSKWTVRTPGTSTVFPVEVIKVQKNGAILCRDLRDGSEMTVKSPRRFREWMDTANVRFQRAN